MIVLNYIKAMKNHISDAKTFKELLERSASIKELSEIVEYFNTINIREKDTLIHLKYNNKIMFKRNWDVFYETVRGIVLDWKNEELLLYPFDKFYELNEHKITELGKVKKKWKEAKLIEITDKVDGSLMISRYIKNSFLTVSSGSFEGYHVDSANKLIYNDVEMQRFLKDHNKYTVMFEMKVKDLPQHIKYGEDSLTIIGMRNMDNNELLSLKQIKELTKDYKVNVVSSFELTIDEILPLLEDPKSVIEGYIVRLDNLLVKFKTKNFIMANRYKGEPSRNFNVLVDAINEGREDSIGELISIDFKESYDIGIQILNEYVDKKEEKFNLMLNELDFTLDNNEFAKEAQIKFPDNVKELMTYKLKRNKKINKDDMKHLKKFADKFTCVSHFKYAELNNIDKSDVIKDLESGKIKYLKKFDDSYTGETVYIIHKWQWLDKDKVLSII